MKANTWRIDVEFGKETYVAQGHLEPLTALRLDNAGMLGEDVAKVEIQALVRGSFSNSGVVSTVHLSCHQSEEKLALAQEKATELAMEGLRNGWEILQERIAKGHFPGCADERR